MKAIPALRLMGFLLAVGFAAGALAQDGAAAGTATGADTASSPATAEVRESKAQLRLIQSYSGLAGSEDNARSLVTGLRRGGEITLDAAEAGGAGVTFTSPTRPMGYGNVRIALALAQERLAQEGITQPTPAQLQAALTGGAVTSATGGGTAATSTEFRGVLQMRADGMGWGRIANSMGVKLGHVISGRTRPPAPDSTSSGTTTAVGTGGATAAGITTASGAAPANVSSRVRGNSASAHTARQPGNGIVTAAGHAAPGSSAAARVQSTGIGTGVVTATGAAAGGRASAAGRGQGRGRADR